MTVLGEIESWRDLHNVIRKHLLPSCTQYVTRVRDKTFEIANDPILSPIQDEILEVIETLADEKEERKGKKGKITTRW